MIGPPTNVTADRPEPPPPPPRAHRRSWALAALLAACAPAGAPEHPNPTRPSPRRLRQGAALILSVEDSTRGPRREGAHRTASRWYDHLRRVRGLPRWRIRWLKDAAVEPEAIARALAQVHWRIGEDATLWVIFVGRAVHGPAAPDGLLLGPTASPDAGAPLNPLLARAGHGLHRELIAVLDGCHPDADAPWSSGLPARAPPSLTDVLRRAKWASASADTLEAILAETGAQMMRDLKQRQRQPTDTIVFTSGVGSRCADPSRGPGLADLLLDALTAAPDHDGDGALSVTEALRHIHARVTREPGPRARVEANGANLNLAFGTPSSRPPPPRPHLDAEPLHLDTVAYTPEPRLRIDRGPFTQGCPSRRDPECERDERPTRRTVLDRYFIDPTEVTWASYQRCVDDGACPPVDPALCEVWTGHKFIRGAPIPEHLRRPDLPVTCVPWHAAVTYCAWAGGRLPTEAEWERAARGPHDRRRYPWGDAPPRCDLARSSGCGDGPAPAFAHPAGRSPDGVHDLAGNVAEWVADWYHPRAHRQNPTENPAGPDHGRVRVVRGGSFYDPPSDLRASYRYGLTPTFGYGIVGFRCAR